MVNLRKAGLFESWTFLWRSLEDAKLLPSAQPQPQPPELNVEASRLNLLVKKKHIIGLKNHVERIQLTLNLPTFSISCMDMVDIWKQFKTREMHEYG